MASRKLIYVISEVNKVLHFEWIVNHLKSKYLLRFVLVDAKGDELEKFLKSNGIKVYRIGTAGTFSMGVALLKLIKIIHQERPDIIHSHLWRADVLSQMAGWLLRVPKRVTTRHHAMVHYENFPDGRKWDLLCNALATDIIAISHNSYNILTTLDRADHLKVHLIPHGFDLSYFKELNVSDIETLRLKYGVKFKKPIVGVIARYTEWKGIQYVIPAFSTLLVEYPEAHLMLANAHGEYSKVIKTMLRSLPEGTYTEIEFEDDLASLYKLFDVYVHVPVNGNSEAFGQTYIEALASGIPSIFTLSGIAPEFIVDRFNALVVEYQKSDEIALKLREVLSDRELAGSLISGGYASVMNYSIEVMVKKLELVYG
jgi:glycosyltransferase involved in cell wall biosynthesis